MIIKLNEVTQQIEAPSNSISIVDLLKQAYEKGLFKKLKCDGRKNAVRMDISGLDKDRLIAYFDKRSEFNREDNTESGIHSAEFISDEFDIEIFDSFIQIYKLIDTEAIRKLTADDLQKLLSENINDESTSNKHAYDDVCRKVEQEVIDGKREVIAVDVDEWFDMMDKYQLKELDNLTTDLSQGTGNVIVYYGYNIDNDTVYKYASY